MVVCEGMRWLTLDRDGSVKMTLHQSNLTFKENIETFKPWRLCLAPESVKESWCGHSSEAGRSPNAHNKTFEVLCANRNPGTLECKSVILWGQ